MTVTSVIGHLYGLDFDEYTGPTRIASMVMVLEGARLGFKSVVCQGVPAFPVMPAPVRTGTPSSELL